MTSDIQFIKSDANFTVIVPGGCNANCNFCFWTPVKGIPKKLWRKELDAALEKLHDQNLLTQISVSGGEPTCSPLLSECLQAIRTFKIQKGIPLKVVLNTNGSHVLEHLHHIEGVVNHVNISRHECDDADNYNVFQTTDVPSLQQLAHICKTLEEAGIDVTLNSVVSENYDNFEEVQNFIDLCKEVGAVRLVLRKNIHGGNLNPLPVETKLGIRKEYNSCPVCATSEYRVKGFPVTVKVGVDEPVSVTEGYAHELIFHPDGKVCLDWEGKKDLPPSVYFREVALRKDGTIVPTNVEEVVSLIQNNTGRAISQGQIFHGSGCGSSSSSGCGSSSRSSGGGGCGG
jgi:pyruvate-formate lyase-activating enzyme